MTAIRAISERNKSQFHVLRKALVEDEYFLLHKCSLRAQSLEDGNIEGAAGPSRDRQQYGRPI